MDNGADVNYTGSDRIPVSGSRSGVASDFSPRAALNQDATILRFLITSGVDVNARYKVRVVRGDYYDNYELSLIQEAALLGAFSATKVLVEQGADVDAASPTIGTALMLVLCERQEDAARFLLQNGADPCFKIALNIADLTLRRVPYGSPIEAAIVGGKPSLVKLLLDWGAVPEDSTVRLATHIAFATEDTRAGRDGNEDRQLITLLDDALKSGKK